MATNIPDSTPNTQPAPPHRDAGFGVVAPTDGRGIRFVAWAIPEACAIDLAAVCRQHGVKPHSTAHFLTESKPH